MNATRTQKVSWSDGIIRRLTAIVCVLWLGGVGCLLGCGTTVFAASVVKPENQAETDSCPMPSGGEHCCHHAKAEPQAASIETLTPTPVQMNCCPLAGQTAEQARATRLVNAPAAIVTNWRPLPAPHLDITHVAPPPYHRRVPDGGSTRLRCCVFLI